MSKQRSPEVEAVLAQPNPHADPSNAEVQTVTTHHGNVSTNCAGPGLADVLLAAGVDGDIFCQDERALEYVSTAPCVASPIAYDQKTDNAMRGAAEIQAQMHNNAIKQHANPQYKEQLKNIAHASSKLPTCDITTFAEGERIILSGQVRDVPNSIDREAGLDVLNFLVGKPRVIQVLRWARSAGPAFVKQPMGWLSQMIAVSSRTAMNADELPEIDVHNIPNEADDKQVFEAIAKVFTTETARNIYNIARMHRVSVLYVFNVLVKKACDDREAIVKPPSSAQSKYQDIEPTLELSAAAIR
jgi:hypothetical protein